MIGQIALLLSLAVDWQAEFCGRSIPFGGTTYYTEHYLVVEVTIQPERARPVNLSSTQFSLRVLAAKNKKPELIPAATAGTVSAAMKYPDWERRRGLETYGGVGNTGVILGQPRRTEPRFPGDPTTRPPLPDRTKPNQVETVDPENPRTAPEVVVKAALVEGPTLGETKGLLYFDWRGKLKDARRIEIVWRSPQGDEQVIELR